MNIIFSLCGKGERFSKEGFIVPKFLIPYNGATMLYHAVETLGVRGNLYFIVKDEHLKSHKFLEQMLRDMGGEIIVCYEQTEGAAESLLLAEEFIKDKSLPMISANCDQFMDWDSKLFIDKLKKDVDSSFIVTFPNDEEKCSYVRLYKDNVVEVREKKVISNMATVGIYHWAKTSDFFIDAKQMIKDDVRDNNEYYVAPVYNYTIGRGLKVKIHNIRKEEFSPIGTPIDYINFSASNKNFE